MSEKIKITCPAVLADELQEIDILEREEVKDDGHYLDPSFFTNNTVNALCTIITILQAPSAIEYVYNKVTDYFKSRKRSSHPDETIRIQTPQRVFILTPESKQEDWDELRNYLEKH